MMGKCGCKEGFDCEDIRSTEMRYVGCDNRASRCAAYGPATKNNPETDVVDYCRYDGCEFDGNQWIYKDGIGDEYYYYPDQDKCRSYVNGRWD